MVIALGGEWDIWNRELLAQMLLPASEAPEVTLDLSGMRFASSAFLSRLIALHRERQRRGLPAAKIVVDFALVMRVLRSARFDEIFEIECATESA